MRKLSRTGSSVGLLIQICEWQFMHVLVGGITAQSEFSTDVWQYRQSIPIEPDMMGMAERDRLFAHIALPRREIRIRDQFKKGAAARQRHQRDDDARSRANEFVTRFEDL